MATAERSDASAAVPRPPARRRGLLRVYLGAAPGVGKTFAMLNEGRRRAERGGDVVVAFVETHGRARTAEQIRGLEVVPRCRRQHRGTTFEEMDLDAVLARAPEVALVDELAHTNVPGGRHDKRWQDVVELLEAGITVVSTVNIQHLESLNDVVERITGVVQRETLPDRVVRSADQIELVDQAPEALRRRMAHGNVYRPEQIDAALANYFRIGNLSALRELALLWVADRVDESLDEYRERHGITRPWETRERVVVAITGAPDGEHLVRRAARIAQRAHGELIGVHVTADTGLVDLSGEHLTEQRQLLEALGGQFREAAGADVAEVLVDVARAENGTQIVLGATKRSRWYELWHGSVVNRVLRLSGPIDVHVISPRPPPGEAPSPPLPPRRRVLSPVSARRQALGWLMAVVGLPVLTLLLANLRASFGLPSVLLLFLVLAMAVAAVGGVFPALAASVGGFLLANWYFTPPLHQLDIAEAENLLALLVYLGAAGVVSVLVDRVGRSRLQAARSRAEAEAMAALAGSLAEEEALPLLVSHLRATFGMRAAALLERGADDAGGRATWTVVVADGEPVPATPDDADAVKELGKGLVLVLAGGHLAPEDHRVLNALAAQLAAAEESRTLHAAAERAGSLERANDLRAALLQAVSHDLRTPIASIKATISSIRSDDVTWSADQLAEFHATIEEEIDRLGALVTNLLDMSRLQAGVVRVNVEPVSVEEVVPVAVASLGPRGRAVVLEVAESVPAVLADAALLQRAVANLVDNAVTASVGGPPVRVTGGAVGGDHVDLRIIDQGVGIAPADRDAVFEPFHRLGDHGTGVGLGLAIARGFVTAMGGELVVEDTPGGGVTMVISLPEATG